MVLRMTAVLMYWVKIVNVDKTQDCYVNMFVYNRWVQ